MNKEYLKAQPSGVLLPEPMKRGEEGGSGEYGAAMIRGYNACLREVARLNSSIASVGGVDERAAFEAWYLGHFYMGDNQCGLEWLSTEPCGGYRHQHPAEQWIVWQARAALSAPSHGEQVREQQWQLIHDTLRNYRMGTLSDGEGGYPLIDAMTADGQSVSGGIEECTYLADAIWNVLAAAPSAGSQKDQGE